MYTYQTEITKIADYDVVVIGGGPSGMMAAVAAARSGCRTAVIERYGFLGGMATAGFVAPISEFCYNNQVVIGGLPWEFVNRLAERGGAKIEYPLGNISFSPAAFQTEAEKFVRESGAALILHAEFIDCIQRDNNIIEAAVLHTKEGFSAIRGKVFLDCSGDGDLAFRAGVPMQKPFSSRQPATLYFMLSGVDISSMEKVHHCRQGVNYHMEDLQKALKEAAQTEELPLYGGPWMCYMMNPDTVLVNITRSDADVLNDAEFTAAECQLREDAYCLVDALRKKVPALRNASIIAFASQTGIRESRHIRGVMVLNGDDYVNAVHFPDSVSRAAHPVDIHAASSTQQRCDFLKEAACIPYRSLIAEDYPNLIVACRSFSADRVAFASARVMASMMGIGQAGGFAAAQSLAEGKKVQDIDTDRLRETLIATGANI